MKTFVIGEIGINHNGDLNIAKKLIKKAASFGADAVKFQKRDIDLVYSAKELHNPNLMEHARCFENNQIIFCYDDVIVIKKDAKVLKLQSVSGPLKHLQVGTKIADWYFNNIARVCTDIVKI